MIAFPNQLICSKSDLLQSSGLFPEIHYYWLVKDNKVILWSYTKKHDLIIPDEFSQQITHVLLSKAMKNVFDDNVTVHFLACGHFLAFTRCHNSYRNNRLSHVLFYGWRRMTPS